MMPTNSETCLLLEIGSIDYQKALEIQRTLHRRVVEGSLPNLIMILQHPHVFTQGRRGKPEHILASCNELRSLGIKVHYVDRGGEATYHGPGQIVCYPIMNIRRWGVRKYVSILETIIIDSLSVYGISGLVRCRTAGVWVGDAKIAAVGLKISGGVSMHGFALNVSPDLSYLSNSASIWESSIAVDTNPMDRSPTTKLALSMLPVKTCCARDSSSSRTALARAR